MPNAMHLPLSSADDNNTWGSQKLSGPEDLTWMFVLRMHRKPVWVLKAKAGEN